MSTAKTAEQRNRTPQVIRAPKWLELRMESLRRMRPPTLREVALQLKASAEFRRRLTGKKRA